MSELSHKSFDQDFEDFETDPGIVNLQNLPVDKQRHFIRIFCVAYALATISLIAFGDVARCVIYALHPPPHPRSIPRTPV